MTSIFQLSACLLGLFVTSISAEDASMTDPRHHTINYIELPMSDVAATKAFYGQVFGWKFQDWGPTYVSFEGAGIDGGFDADGIQRSDHGALVILYSADLTSSQAAVEAAGGTITKPIFSFPGGRRFHFEDPNGNQLAVWTITAE